MKKIIIPTVVAFLITACESRPAGNNQLNHQKQTTMNDTTEKKAIEQLLFSYQDALNASSTAMVLPLYTGTGVFMPSGAPTAVGQQQVKAAYDFVFASIRLSIQFYIDEIVINGQEAFARTTSRGTTLIHASGETVPEENRELFVLQKENGSWKIARYMFNKMK